MMSLNVKYMSDKLHTHKGFFKILKNLINREPLPEVLKDYDIYKCNRAPDKNKNKKEKKARVANERRKRFANAKLEIRMKKGIEKPMIEEEHKKPDSLERIMNDPTLMLDDE